MKDTRHERIRQRAQLQGVRPVGKHIFSLAVRQGHIDVHAGAVNSLLGLRHKGSVEAMALGNGLGRHFEGHDIVCRPECLGVLEINLVLGRRDLVVAGLHLKAHILQIQHNIPAHIFRQVNRRNIKIPCHLVGLGGGPPLLVGVEQEEFTLRPHLEGISHGLCPGHGLPQHITGITRKGRAVRIVHVADQAGHLSLLGTPGKYLKGIKIRIEVHIGLINPHKALDGGAVKHTLVIQGLLQLAGRNCHIFQLSKYIRKLKADELHILLPGHTDNIILVVSAHLFSPFPPDPAAAILRIGPAGQTNRGRTPCKALPPIPSHNRQ